MRNGTCGYGTRCVFNHPDPTPITGMGSPNSSVDDKFGRQLSHPLEKHNGLPIHFSGDSQPDQASRFLYTFSDNTISYPNSHSSYVTPHTPSQQMQKQSEWNGYQVAQSFSLTEAFFFYFFDKIATFISDSVSGNDFSASSLYHSSFLFFSSCYVHFQFRGAISYLLMFPNS